MSIVVNTNTQSLFAQRALSTNTGKLQKSVEKLSTGFRINRAGDDAAGLSISEKLTATIRGFDKAKQNVGDAISMVQTAEGALGVIQDNLQRIRELVVQASNGTNGNKEKDAIQREINERVTTIDDIAKSTKFNGLGLIKAGVANHGNKSIQVGADNGDTMAIKLSEIDIDIADTAANTLGENGIQLTKLHVGGSSTVTAHDGSTSSATTTPLTSLDNMLDNLSRMRSQLGAIQNSLESRSEFLDVAIENASASRSRIKDVDVAQESSSLVKHQILQQSAGAMLSQANATPQLALNLLP